MSAHSLGSEALSALMPMHLILSAEGRVIAMGPTCQKTLGSQALGKSLWEIFDIRQAKASMAELQAHLSKRLHLSRRADPPQHFRGIAVALSNGNLLINLSFGVHLPQAVRLHDLSIGDFAPTDIAMELLCLIEVNGLARSQLSSLNKQLRTEKTLAEIEARTDPLTGLSNRRALTSALEDRIALNQPFALMRIDVDRFKEINDMHGHAIGDLALTQLAGVLRQITRKGDLIARVGGDEFVVLLPELTAPRKLQRVAERIRLALRPPLPRLPLSLIHI